jgi:hypothetical protein
MRASYRAGVRWIANEDEVYEFEHARIAEFVSVALLADLFGRTVENVARDVIRCRIKNGLVESKRDAAVGVDLERAGHHAR